MIVHVWRRAMEAAIGPVYVAAAEPEIAAAVRGGGRRGGADRPGPSVRFRPHFRGPRARSIPHRRFDAVVNVQGDLPTLDPDDASAAPWSRSPIRWSISRRLAVEITREAERNDPNVVKAVAALAPQGRSIARALYFSRATVPANPTRPRAALPSRRPLRLSPRGAGALRQPAAGHPGAAREAGAAPGAGGRHAHRRGAR